MHEGYRDVTIAEVLTHTAGLPREVGMLSDPPAHTRGTYAYSNLGYILLGQIAEKTAGKPFETLVREEIFIPLGMQSAGFGSPASNTQGVADAPWGHRHDNETHALIADNSDNPPIYAPAGTVHASVSDWLKFLKYELKQPRIHHPNLLVADERGQKYTDSAFIEIKGGFLHDGSNGFNYARQVLLPDKKAAFVIVSNDGSKYAQQAIEEISVYLIQRIQNDHSLIESAATGISPNTHTK